MAKRDFETWLGTSEDSAENEVKRRFALQYYDLLHDITEKGLASSQNRFRLAGYVVWWHTPKNLRVPKFQNDLANQMGMADDDLFRKWRKEYKELFDQSAAETSVKQLILEALPDVVQASINCAINGGVQGFQDRKLVLEIAEVYKPKSSQEVTGKDGTELRIILDR